MTAVLDYSLYYYRLAGLQTGFVDSMRSIAFTAAIAKYLVGDLGFGYSATRPIYTTHLEFALVVPF